MKRDFETDLNDPQLEAVRTIEGPVLIIAGAGSGKTTVITCRIARMLEAGIPQHAILALTFTNKAAREMEKRVKELTGKKLQSLTVSTFHAFGVKILKEEIETLGYRKNFSIYDETDQKELIKETLRECGLRTDVNLYSLAQLFSGIKTGRYSWREAPAPGAAGIAGGGDYERVYREYLHSLKVYNALDFDDLLVLPIELFESRPEILDKYRKRYRYIMVDEFQDTSLVQYRLMRLLVLGSPDGESSPDQSGSAAPNICVVGDDDQSIYSWRGANYENLLRFERDFPGRREIKLEQNYRSTTTILEAANGVISHNTNRKEKTLWSGQGGGKPIELYFPLNESEEGDFIAGKIRELMLRDGLGYDGFGVLLRTNSMTRSIEEAFLESNIPYKVSGDMSFFQRKEIKDILSYLRVIANTSDDLNLLRIINTPRRGIGKTSILAVSDLARNNKTVLWDAMDRLCRLPSGMNSPLPPKTQAELDLFMTLIESFRERMLGERKGLAEKVRSLVDHIDYRSYLAAEFSKNEKIARWKFANIEYFIQSIENWERDPDNLDPGLYAWLNRISLITSNDQEEETGKVNLMTIHAAKGLEFPVVFIAGAEEGIIPHTRSLEEAGEGEEQGKLPALEEERRLFYVAITRARNKLYITSCRRRRRLQETVECAPSPFLAEIPPHLVETVDGSAPVEGPMEAEAFFAKIKDTFK